MKRWQRWTSTLFTATLLCSLASPVWAAQVEGHADSHDAQHGAAHQAGPAAGHGDAHGEDHGPGPINLFHGFLGEKDGVEPSVLWRKPGTQPPLGALLLNTAVLFFLLYRFGARPVSEALKKRKSDIMEGMDNAARMKEEAAEQLAGYEDRLDNLDDEIKRVRREMREAAESERKRVLSEAKERRQRMERDAKLLVDQELKATQEALMKATVESAMQSATQALAAKITPDDQRRLAEEYVKNLDTALASLAKGRAA